MSLDKVLGDVVDATAQLILSVATENFTGVKENCISLANNTQTLVKMIQQLALKSKDATYQVGATNIIIKMSESIGALVSSFNVLLQNPLDGENKKKFAIASKNVGEAINELMLLTDRAASQKLEKAILKLMTIGKKNNPSQLTSENDSVVAMAEHVAEHTADPEKKKELQHAIRAIQSSAPTYLNSNGNQHFETAAVGKAYQDLLRACKIDPLSFINKVHEMMEYIQKLMEMSQNLKEAAHRLRRVALGELDAPFADAAKAVAQHAIALVQQAQKNLEKIDDPVKRLQVQDLCNDIKDYASNLIKAAKEAKADPTNIEKRNALLSAEQRLVNHVERLEQLLERINQDAQRAAAGNATELDDDALKIKFANTLHYLERKADELVEDAVAKGDKRHFVKTCKVAGEVAQQMVKDGNKLAGRVTICENPQEKKELLQAISDTKNAAVNLMKQAQTYVNDPAKAGTQGKRDVNDAYRNLAKCLHTAKVKAKITTEDEKEAGIVAGDNELLQAALEEVDMAQLLADEAELRLAKMTDASRKKAAQDAIAELRRRADEVLAAARILADNPEDEGAQRALAEAQKNLANAIQKVVEATSEEDAALRRAMADMQSTADVLANEGGEVVQKARELIDFIDDRFGSSSTSPEAALKSAREIASKTNELARLLRALLAKGKGDDASKKELLDLVNVIKDRSIQVKIIAAVKCAGGGGSGAVSSAAHGLAGTIKEILNVLCAETLKRRVAATQMQVSAIKAVLEAYRKK
eukprot:TRINITY_DN5166_c0_g5_i1.p1 TRINITY_DN5166_c0_g5~~TRINITY_DN5166_c0_g5_i1.p1  ORF type:complete len:758 (+),score=204.67 TRINITY_DN5166_c0_g5_i1:40-2313(+)